MDKHKPKRTIQNAIDTETGELINAETLNDELYAKHFRTRINDKKEYIVCLECENELAVGVNKKNKEFSTYYFYHRSNYAECDLVNGQISKKEADKLNRIYASKETERHRHLKQLIHDKLLLENAVDKQSIKIEKWIFENNKLERRPDVYCKKDDLEIAFEVQVTDLSQRYLLERSNFYKKEKIHNIWIVDKFEIDDDKQFFIDIKELNDYRNIFKLNEHTQQLTIDCFFPELYLTDKLEIEEKIIKKSVQFTDLKFDNNFQVYFYDYPRELREIGSKKEKIIKERENRRIEKEQERKRQEEQRIKDIETDWQNKWLQLTRQSNRQDVSSPKISEHCYFYIRPNNELIVFFPENRITADEISEIERQNTNILWVVNAIETFRRGDIRSIVKSKLNDLETHFSEEKREKIKNDFENDERSLSYKLDNLQIDTERLETDLIKYTNNYNNPDEIKEKIIQTILDGAYYYDYYELINLIREKYQDNLKEAKQNINKIKQELIEIDKVFKTISGYENGIGDLQHLKILPEIPEKEIIEKHFANFTIIEKNTYNSLFKVVIEKGKLPFVYYKPKDYVYLYDYTNKKANLNGRKEELFDTEKEIISANKTVNKQISDEVKAFFASKIKNTKGEIIAIQNKILETKQEIETIKKNYNEQIDNYNSEKGQIMKDFNGLYEFNWKDDIEKWRYSQYPVFLDTGDNYVFWINDTYQLKKISNVDFVQKLITIKKTKKKWL